MLTKVQLAMIFVVTYTELRGKGCEATLGAIKLTQNSPVYHKSPELLISLVLKPLI